MSVLIKGMELPKNCFECVCEHKFFGKLKCYEFSDFEFDGTEKFPHMEDRSRYCPLVEVPTPHGRLIDADAFLARNAYFAERDFINSKYDDTLKDLIDRTETVIEAEE